MSQSQSPDHVRPTPEPVSPPLRPSEEEERSGEVTTVSDEDSLETPPRSGTRGGSVKTRRNWCTYCETMQTKLIRHMMTKHPAAPEIIRYKQVTDPDPIVQKKKRKEMCRFIVNRSNRVYNEKVVALKILGEPLPLKRSKKCRVTALSHVVCPRCQGLVTKKYFASHSRICSTKCPVPDDDGRSLRPSFLRPTLEPEYRQLENQIFPKMAKDEVGYIAQTDRLILQFGRRFLRSHMADHQRNYVSSQMRTLAGLVLRFKNVDPVNVKTLSDCLDPTNFDNLCKVVRNWSGFDEDSGICSKGSVPRRLCKSLKMCSKIMWSETIKDKYISVERQIEIRNKHERFMALMESDWSVEVNSAADKSLKIQKVAKEDKMPLSEDIKKYFRNMTAEIVRCTERLNNRHDRESYLELVEACIAYLIVFNCRRPSEVAYATVENYTTTLKTRSTRVDDESVSADSCDDEDRLAVFTVAALKNDVKVPVIVPFTVRTAIDALVEHRAQCGVSGNLLFGKIDGSAYNGGALLNKFKSDMNLKKPADFSANGFRHYWATVSQLDPEMKRHMPKFLGHTLTTHSKFYELPMTDIHLEVIGPSLSRCCLSDTTAVTDDCAKSDEPVAADNWNPVTTSSTIDYTNPMPGTSKNTATDLCLCAADHSMPAPTSLEIDYTNPVPGTSKNTATDFCLGIMPLRDLNEDSDSEYSDDDKLTGKEKKGKPGVTPSSPSCSTRSIPTPVSPMSPPPVGTSRVLPTRVSRPTTIQGVSSPLHDDRSQDPSFEDRLCSPDTSDTDASPLRLVRAKNKWTTPERQELYDGLPKTMLGLEQAGRGRIRSVWENSKFIKTRHSLQTTRIEVSKHFTRKKRIATPVRKIMLEKLNLPETEL